MTNGKASPVLEVDGLSVGFTSRKVVPLAVKNFSISIQQGEIVGVVGESGSGKSVSAAAITHLLPGNAQVEAETMRLNGRDLQTASDRDMLRIRGTEVAMVFQDPMNTLNPLMKIRRQMREAIEVHDGLMAEADKRIANLLTALHFAEPERVLESYPHELSGGMRQRIAVACALINEPSLLIADEPTTALDVTVEMEVIQLVEELCRNRNTAVMWITHDLSLLEKFADRVLVLYAGEVVETGAVEQVFSDPQHPYTQGLLNSIPRRNPRGAALPQIPGMLNLEARRTAGCAFASRCVQSKDVCATKPATQPIAKGWESKCHFSAAPGREEALR